MLINNKIPKGNSSDLGGMPGAAVERTKDFFRIDELPFSRPHAYKLFRDGKLELKKRDGRVFVLREDLLNYIKNGKS